MNAIFDLLSHVRSSAAAAVSRLSAVALLAGCMSAPLVATPASANDLYVKYDQSQLIRLPRPVAEVIIGNATIADVAVKSGDLLVITGKSFGITNIIALDASRNVIQDQRVIVQRDELATVNVQLGNSRRSYNCSPQCNPSITVGDDREYLSQVAGDTLKKIKMSEDIRSQGGQAR